MLPGPPSWRRIWEPTVAREGVSFWLTKLNQTFAGFLGGGLDLTEWMFDPDKDIQDFDEAIEGISHELYRHGLNECLQKIVQLRRDFGGHKVLLTVSVAQLMCIDCAASWRWVFPELQDKDWTDIDKEGWEVDLLLLGFHPSVVEELKEAVSEEIDAAVLGPFCYDCRRPLPYWEDEDSACHVVKESFHENFPRVPGLPSPGPDAPG